MSADNYIIVRKEGDSWCGYMESASLNNPLYNSLLFKVPTISDALEHAQAEKAEYGYVVELEKENNCTA